MSVTYETKAFTQQSIQLLADDINTFLAANPSFTPIEIENTVEGAGFYALLIYST